jgi:phosphoglycolate phosphatase-like HAD superfamily hydrolase
MRLAIFDIDNFVANRDARLERARVVYLEETREQGKDPKPLSFMNGFDKSIFFDPEMLFWDRPFPGTNDNLNALIDQGWTLVFLSSRLEEARENTLEWFALYIFIRQSCEIILKGERDRHQKTSLWKTRQVSRLVAQYHPDEVILGDDQVENLEAMALVLTVPFALYTSLDEAVRGQRGSGDAL